MRYYIRLAKRFFALKATNKKLLIELIVTALLRTVTYLIIPAVAALVVDAATDQKFNEALLYTGLFLITAFVYVFFHRLNYNSYAKNSAYIHDTLQRKILDKITTLEPDYTKKFSRAEIVNTSHNDVEACQKIPDFLFDFIAMSIGLAIDTVILIVVDPLIGGIALGLSLVSFIFFFYHMRKRDYYCGSKRERQDELASLYAQIIDGHKEVHTFNLKEQLREVQENKKKEWRHFYRRQLIHHDIGNTITPLLLGLSRIITYLITANLILKGEYNVATLVLVIGYYENMRKSYDEATDTILWLSKSNNAVLRVYRFLSYKPTKKAKFGDNDNDDIAGTVEFKNVSFTYGRRPLMRNVSFKLKPGSLTGIVGKSGSGKSTIFRLLLRLYKPTRGSITIDGKKINEYTKEVYATNVSIVNQKPFVFDMSIRENLAMVDKDVDRQIEACKKVGIHDYIMRLEKGYDTVLVADGSNMSAGHKQLLSLARTLLSKSEILLFDEITSTLDADSTKQIIKVLKNLKDDHTVIVITHKPEVMRSMDNLIVIDQGRIVGRGRHKDLLKNKYYKLLQK